MAAEKSTIEKIQDVFKDVQGVSVERTTGGYCVKGAGKNGASAKKAEVLSVVYASQPGGYEVKFEG